MAAQDEENKTDDDYHCTHVRLGRGGFANVFLGTHPQTHEPVAIKKIQKAALIQRGEAYRLHQEVQAGHDLSHQNIVAVRAVRETAAEIELVLEYCPDGDLLRRVNKHGPSESMAKAVLSQMVPALIYTHNHGWAHLDVKLENILISGDRYVLADWGLAMPFQRGSPVRSGCGSLLYCPPEMLSSKIFYPMPVDVWSLGVCLFAMLTARLPYSGATCSEIQESIHRKPLELPEHVSPACRDLVLRMLDPNPQRRITMEQIASHPFLRRGSLRIPPVRSYEDMLTTKRSTAGSLKRVLDRSPLRGILEH